jgi:hypothetical protein
LIALSKFLISIMRTKGCALFLGKYMTITSEPMTDTSFEEYPKPWESFGSISRLIMGFYSRQDSNPKVSEEQFRAAIDEVFPVGQNEGDQSSLLTEGVWVGIVSIRHKPDFRVALNELVAASGGGDALQGLADDVIPNLDAGDKRIMAASVALDRLGSFALGATMMPSAETSQAT